MWTVLVYTRYEDLTAISLKVTGLRVPSKRRPAVASNTTVIFTVGLSEELLKLAVKGSMAVNNMNLS
jgi:hypothetical protein